MKRAVVIGTAIFVLMAGAASTAWADEGINGQGDRGNHGAIWKDGNHLGPDATGREWGEFASGAATGGYLKDRGVSGNVHLDKNQSVPGQNK